MAGLVHGTATLVPAASSARTVTVDVLTHYGIKTLSAGGVPADQSAALAAQLARGNLVDWIPAANPTAASNVMVAADSSAFNVILSKGNSTAAQFNLAKYGAAVTSKNGVPGPMVAAGW